MDPFEARLQFIQILEQLHPSSLTLGKAIGFALKNLELHEDFHSVILEVLDKLDLNARMNVMYFIEALVSTVATQNSSKTIEDRPYLSKIHSDFTLILEKVIPNDKLSNLNGSVDILREVEGYYGVDNKKLRDAYFKLTIDNPSEKIGDVEEEGFAQAWKYLIEKKKIGLHDRLKLLSEVPSEDLTEQNAASDDLVHLTHKQILQRMENDRERHKRYKETNWVVNRSTGKIDREEFDKVWRQFGPVDEDDYHELKDLYKSSGESYGNL